MYKGTGAALLIFSRFSEISNENEKIWSQSPNYFIFIGYVITGARRGVRANPLKPPVV